MEPADVPRLYFDLGSPYAYLALERAPTVLGVRPRLRPVLLGAMFARRGWGSWAQSGEREARIADIEQRARRQGLPALVWPAQWPANGLSAMRAAVWAERRGRVDAFARAILRLQFAEGADIASVEVLRACATVAGLDPEALATAITTGPIKDALRQATESAWEAGVRGIPTLAIGSELFYGDDRLEAAHEHLSRLRTVPS